MGFIIILLLMIAIMVVIHYVCKSIPDSKKTKNILMGGMFASVITVIISNSFLIVEPGNSAFPVVLGVVDTKTIYSEGPHFINPVAVIEKYNTKRRTIEQVGEEALTAPSKDRVQLTIDVTLTFRTNPKYIGLIHQKIGIDHIDRILLPASRAAIRGASANFDWADAAIAKREEFAIAITEEFRKAIISDLIGNGFDEKDAPAVYLIGHSQLRQALPPESILTSISERLSAEEDLKKQDTLTNIATKEALRRKEEGDGIRNLLNQALGQEEGTAYSPEAVRIVLGAIADKTRADALAKAALSDKISIMVMDGGASPAVMVPTGKSVINGVEK